MDPADLIAFIDESSKPIRDRKNGKVNPNAWHYVVASAVVFQDDLERYRQQINEIEQSLGYNLHYFELRSEKRRVEAIEAITALDG